MVLFTAGGLALSLFVGCGDDVKESKRETWIRATKESRSRTVQATNEHFMHVEAGLECKQCHAGAETQLNAREANSLCQACHADVTVCSSTWEAHCICCHRFENDNDAGVKTIAEDQCAACHKLGIAAGFTTRAVHLCQHAELDCAACHSIHSTDTVFTADQCSQCHAQDMPLDELKPGHMACTLCHVPEAWMPESLSCETCHHKPSSVLAHRLDVHPSECDACHDAHYRDTDLAGQYCSACHGDLRYQPPDDAPS